MSILKESNKKFLKLLNDWAKKHIKKHLSYMSKDSHYNDLIQLYLNSKTQFKILKQEQSLLRRVNRQNSVFLNKVLHENFIEKVEDGTIWDKKKIIQYLLEDKSETKYHLVSYSWEECSKDKFVIKYTLRKGHGLNWNISERRSVWTYEKQWRMLYHEVL